MAHEVMNHDRPERPASAPATPPPAAGRPTQAALPVGVRDGDVLMVGVSGELDLAQLHSIRSELRLAFGDVSVVFVPGGRDGVTVLRPER